MDRNTRTLEIMELSNFWRGKRVLITGHTGFKGSWLSLWLNSIGANVFGFAQSPDTSPSLFEQLGLSEKITHQIGDICNADEIYNFVKFSKPDVIFHLAAQPLVLRGYSETIPTWNSNVMGTVNLLQATRDLKHPCAIVAVTTDKVYSNIEAHHFYTEDDRLGGLDPYSASKAAAELVIESYRFIFSHEGLPIHIVSARAGNVIGGGDWANDRLIPDIVRALSAGKPIEVRNPSSVRPWQHVLEPLLGYMAMAESVAKGEGCATSLNFGPEPSELRSVKDVIDAALKHWPGTYFNVSLSQSPHEAGLLMLSIDKAKKNLSWAPKWDFSTTIEKSIQWYKAVENGVDASDLCLQQIKDYIED